MTCSCAERPADRSLACWPRTLAALLTAFTAFTALWLASSASPLPVAERAPSRPLAAPAESALARIATDAAIAAGQSEV